MQCVRSEVGNAGAKDQTKWGSEHVVVPNSAVASSSERPFGFAAPRGHIQHPQCTGPAWPARIDALCHGVTWLVWPFAASIFTTQARTSKCPCIIIRTRQYSNQSGCTGGPRPLPTTTWTAHAGHEILLLLAGLVLWRCLAGGSAWSWRGLFTRHPPPPHQDARERSTPRRQP